MVTLDLLGHGRSDRPADPLVYSMTAFAEQVVALLDHLGAAAGGRRRHLARAPTSRSRWRRSRPSGCEGLIVEMPVLDNAVEAGILAFAPLLFAARFLPFTVNAVRLVTRPIPRGIVPFWAGIVLDTLDQRADSMAAVVHGLFFGRLAPSSKQRRAITAPALVVGHPADPIHPAADAAMLAEELPQRDVREGAQHPGVAGPPRPAEPGRGRVLPGRLEGAAPEPSYRFLTPCAGENGGVPLYRDEAIVLRTHKLGEADRIVTLLTRHHGRVRAVAKGVRRTTSKFGARLEPFTHVDLQLAEGRNLDVITQAETRTAFSSELGLDYERYTSGTVMLETAERLVVRGEGALDPAVPAAGRRAARDGRRRAPTRAGARLLPAALAVGRGLRAVVRRLRPLRPRGAAPLGEPVDGRRPLLHLSAARLRQPGGRDDRRARRAAHRRLGGASRRPSRGTTRRPPAWSPRS